MAFTPNYKSFSYRDMKKWSVILLVLASCFVIPTFGQKLNNPNRRGPLGTQVNAVSGNLFLPRTDFMIPSKGFNLDITFYYNSFLFFEEKGYGRGWNFRYNIRIDRDSSGNRVILWGDGREDKYDSLPGGNYKSPKGYFNTFSQYQPGKFLLSELNGRKFYFDNAVHRGITRLEDANGNFINFNYSDSLLGSIVNNSGQSISFTYNSQGKLLTVVDAVATPSRTFTYTYDAAGNLKEVKDPANGKYQYTYLVNGPMKTFADRNNNKIDIIYYPDVKAREIVGCNKRISFSYDTALKATFVTDHLDAGNQVTKYTYRRIDNRAWVTSMSGNCCGFNIGFEYDENGNQTKMTDANGQVYKYTYDVFGNVLTVTDPLNQVSSYTYTNDFQKLKTYQDPAGNLYTMNYDLRGNLIEMITPGNNIFSATYNAHGQITSSTDAKGNVFTYSYDTWGNPTVVNGPAGYRANLVFDARGNLLSYTDARGNNSTAEYDILNRLKKITDPINSIVQMNYDAEGNLVTYKNKNNEVATLSYDASNRLTQLTGPIGNTQSFTYDGMDNILSIRNEAGNETRLAYDHRNRLKEATNPENDKAIYDYDGNGNVTSVSMPNGQLLNYTYDALNRLISVKDGISTIASFTYDKNGNVTSYTNALGAVSTGIYDQLDRLTRFTDPLGNSTAYTYDKNNNVLTVTDAEGHSTQYLYDSLNRVRSVIDKNGFTITATYDAENNVTALTDQNNNSTTYTYDNLNRKKRTTFPDARYMEYNYDVEGNVTSIRRTDGSIVGFQYDTLNRVIARILPGGETYNYSYDKRGRLLSATNNNGTVSFTYDALDRILTESFDGRTVKHSYSISGRSRSIIYPDSTVITKEYDTRNRLTKILRNNTLVSQYDYNTVNQLTGTRYANGTESIWQYDYASRLSSISTGNIQQSTFTYDRVRNKTSVNRLNNPSQSEHFVYDNGYRLTSYKKGPSGSPNAQNSYSYDAVGNRTAANINGSVKNYSINNLNQVIAVNGTGFTYDERGNLIFDGVFHKTYDAENRLIRDSSSPVSVISYAYDALDRRIRKTVNGAVSKFTYDGAEQIEERNGNNALIRRSIFRNFLSPIVSEQAGSSYYYHLNEMNSVEAITNSNGKMLESYSYDAFGKMTRFDSLNNVLAGSFIGNRFGFTGQEYDSATASYRFFYRDYSPETGVFHQRDLIEYEDGMGMYQYVKNNPANGVDIWGLECPGDKKEDKSFVKEVSEKTVSVYGVVTNDALWDAWVESSVALIPDQVHADLNFQLRNTKNGPKLLRNGLQNLKNTKNAAIASETAQLRNLGKGVKKVGLIGSVIDIGFKGGAMIDEWTNGRSNEQATEEWTATGSLGMALTGFTGPGAVYSILDFGFEYVTDESLTESAGGGMSDLGYWSAHIQYGIPMEWDRSKRECPEGGHQNIFGKIYQSFLANYLALMDIFKAQDPNEIVGPEGQLAKKWVSVKDRMPYTVMFENDSSATARARFIRIRTPIEPKQDPATLELGSVSFNNQTFELPLGRSSYYTRLDARDSTGVFVDLTAGYDVMNNEIFWEFQAIDPLTLLPPEDPLAGFLFLKDSTQTEYGKGFVNFSIKPRANAQTLDTIGARAFIVFDQNEVIPTNIHTNTIDAVAPSSQLTNVFVNGTSINLSWTGNDDINGVGIGHYTIYVSTDRTNYSVLFSKVLGTDTSFTLPTGFEYCFFVLATDRVGNTETLQPQRVSCASIVGVPVTWLYFNGVNRDKDNILKWATASEQNSREFRIERSLNGTSFTQIGTVAAAGNSSSIRQYEYTDRNIDQLRSNVMFYRLKQVDIDGKFKYSSVVKLNYAEKLKPTIVYPNPTSGISTILLSDRSLVGTEAFITDLNGRVLDRIKISAISQTINLRPYVNGVYFIRLANKEVLKVVRQ